MGSPSSVDHHSRARDRCLVVRSKNERDSSANAETPARHHHHFSHAARLSGSAIVTLVLRTRRSPVCVAEGPGSAADGTTQINELRGHHTAAAIRRTSRLGPALPAAGPRTQSTPSLAARHALPPRKILEQDAAPEHDALFVELPLQLGSEVGIPVEDAGDARRTARRTLCWSIRATHYARPPSSGFPVAMLIT